jgi:5-(carboxyamino)imidazole ribonucleotide synthase
MDVSLMFDVGAVAIALACLMIGEARGALRAVAGLPLGDTRALAPVVAMHNILGGPADMGPALEQVMGRYPQAKVELYGKQAQPGRKLGHVTVLGQDVAETRRIAADAAAILMNTEQRKA